MNKEVIIIYKSIFNGNTKKIAQAMAKALHCEAISSDNADSRDLSVYRYVGLGSGIYFTSHHPDIMKIAVRLNSNQSVFIFSSHGAPFLGKYHKPLQDILKKAGISVIGEFSCKGYDCTGPYNLYHGGNKGKPSEKDLYKAEKFVKKILPQYDSKVTVPGGKHIGIDRNACSGCGVCAKVCPMKVLEVIEGSIVIHNEEDCIHCNLCMKNCKEGAIAVVHTKKELIGIAKKHAWRKSL
jgi:ferredoxin